MEQAFFLQLFYGDLLHPITDPCLGWEDTERLIYEIAEMV